RGRGERGLVDDHAHDRVVGGVDDRDRADVDLLHLEDLRHSEEHAEAVLQEDGELFQALVSLVFGGLEHGRSSSAATGRLLMPRPAQAGTNSFSIADVYLPCVAAPLRRARCWKAFCAAPRLAALPFQLTWTACCSARP